MERLNAFLEQAAKRQDLVFALFFVLIVAMLVLPLPTWMIDALLALNLTLSLIVLMTATYLRHPLEMSSFPAIILMTSIMRVALSVATTRLILATGDPGDLIVAFGEFVISGNIVVGLVIFLIIAVVQFMVVTKGAERISKVSARFTLDALPGKQMSIDSDARAGDITPEEAREKRRVLQLEMQFHGAMDGAMRFVKGDAIAGLIIVFINLVGGMTIGMVQRGLTAGEAGQLYVLLSVGDGLIAQIPAMFIAIAAGTIVTRVTTDTQSNLGRDITRQIGGQPKALAIAAVVAAAMGFIPGFPTIVFLILATVLGTIAWLAIRKAAEQEALADGVAQGSQRVSGQPQAGGPENGAQGTGGQGGGETMPADAGPGAQGPAQGPATGLPEGELPLRDAQPGDTLVVRGDPLLLDKLRPDAAYAHVERTKLDFLRTMGFSAPPVGYVYEPQLPPGAVIIDCDAVPVHSFVVPGIVPDRPLDDDQARLYAEELARVRLRRASDLFGLAEAERWLEDIKPAVGRLAAEIGNIVPLFTMVHALRRLLEDGVGLNPPRLVLEGLAQAAQRVQDPDMMAELVRGHLRRQISHAHADAERVVNALVLSPELETNLRRALGLDPSGPAPGSPEEALAQTIEAIVEAHADNRAATPRLSIATAADLRRALQRNLRQADHDIAVLSFTDIAPEYKLRTVAVVRVKDRAAA